MPTVSILIPAYNVENYLPQCLDSVIAQTYHDLQIIIIDDGSKDKTWEVLIDYAAKDGRIEIYHQENQGVAETRNRLLERIKGDYFLFVDADDWIEPDMVAFLLDKAVCSGADISICGMVANDTAVDARFEETIYDRTQTIKEFLRHKHLRGQLWNKLIKYSIINKVTFNPGIGYGEDALFCWCIFQHIKRIYYSTRQLYHYRMNDTSISHSSFSTKKYSAHLVWERITTDVIEYWPQYVNIAKARWAMEDVLLLRSAGLSHFPYNSEVKSLQETIKNNFNFMRKTDFISVNWLVYAFLVSRYYVFAKVV